MNEDGLPAETEPPISEDLQQRGIDFLQGLLASGKVDLDRFHRALDALLGVHTQADFASVVRSLPPPVEFTPPARRRQEPLEISTSMGEVRLEGRWQVSRLTKIDTGMGPVTIDLSQAEFDDWDVEIVVHTHMGTITVIVPRGLEVRPVGRSGPVNTALEPPIPGFPVVRLSATCDMGTIRVMHPTEKKQRRQRWRRRRSKGLPGPCSTHSREPAERHIGFADCCFFCVCFVIPAGCHHARCHVSGEAFRASRGPPAPVRSRTVPALIQSRKVIGSGRRAGC